MNKNIYRFLLRVVHFLIVVYLFAGIFYIYYSAFTQTSSIWLVILVVSLFIEGLVIYLNRGNCPLGYIQRKVGDDTPFFELILPKKYAKKAVRVCAVITLIGIIILDIRLIL